MNEELKNIVEENENAEVVVEIYDEPVESKKIGVGKVALGLGLAGAVAAVILHKTKEKRQARQIKKLEKQGYRVYKIEELEVCEMDQDENEESENEE